MLEGTVQFLTMEYHAYDIMWDGWTMEFEGTCLVVDKGTLDEGLQYCRWDRSSKPYSGRNVCIIWQRGFAPVAMPSKGYLEKSWAKR
jgi:hypothetical protein